MVAVTSACPPSLSSLLTTLAPSFFPAPIVLNPPHLAGPCTPEAHCDSLRFWTRRAPRHRGLVPARKSVLPTSALKDLGTHAHCSRANEYTRPPRG